MIVPFGIEVFGLGTDRLRGAWVWRRGEEFGECSKVPRGAAVEKPFDRSGEHLQRWV